MQDDNFNSSSSLILSRWKEIYSLEQAETFLNTLSSKPAFGSTQCWIALPTPYLKILSEQTWPPQIVLGSCTMESVDEGAFTESTATVALQNAKSRFAFVGEARNRRIFHESDTSINKKLTRLLQAGITPLLCVGETIEQHEQNKTHAVITEQLKNALQGISKEQVEKIIIVFECPWIARSPKVFSVEDWKKVCQNCLNCLLQVYGKNIGSKIRFVYACPEEVIDKKELIEKIPCFGFYPFSLEMILPFIEAYATANIPTLDISAFEFHEEQIFDFAAEELGQPLLEEETQVVSEYAHPGAAEEELEYLKTSEEIQKPSEAAEKVREKPPEGLEIPTPSEKEVEEITEKLEEPEEQPALTEEEEVSSIVESGKPPEELAPEEPAEELAPGMEEQLAAPLAAPEEVSSLIGEPSKTPEDLSEEEFTLRIADIKVKEDALAQLYETLQTKAERLKVLRNNYAILIEKTSDAIDRIDPDLREPLTKGDLEFFKLDQDRMERARPTLELIQETNLTVMEAAAIPREVDRIRPQARELRKQLQEAWDQLHATSLAYKKKHHDFQLPHQPKLLASPPPEIDISLPAPQGPSTLTKKRIGIVKKDRGT